MLLETLRAEPGLLLFAAGLVGLIVGSFLNVVVHRLPLMMMASWRRDASEVLGMEPRDGPPDPVERVNLVTPRSRCPHCKSPITALQNIPLVSYLWLRGRCANCRARIPVRYPAVELLCGLLSVAVAWHFGATAQTLAALILTWSLLAAAVIDMQHQLLPDAIVLPILWLGLLANLFGLFATATSALIGAMAGYMALWLVFQLFRLATGKEGMGYGDFKLLALLGAWLGWQYLPAVIVIASAVGALSGIAMMAGGRMTRNVPIPFGPFLAAAGWLALIWGPALNHAYLQFTGLT